MTARVAVLVGSLREDSLNRKLAQALVALAPEGLDFDFVETGDLPLYNPDLDGAEPPAPWTRLRDQIRTHDAVLFVTPEYNRSVPASLKNALDVGSRPAGQSVWAGKPAAVVTGSPGGIGGFGANHHLRQSLVFLDMPAMQQPEAYIGHLGTLLDAEGRVAEPGTRDFLARIMAAFRDWIGRGAA
ncbi:NAD(P)H-dependent oxidoreductase [Pseudooceanicola sp. CBS1P-1]|uniref:ACP phosphodiesterase n=1 Tax=Pseudooceanicola albus TaxID=2692189 RepID=A0A6L7G836_9RHOB|nr:MULTISPECIES: NAD(P)H-dependent oxidoreductase [Pseudooceanicola]MBT9384088.1 NAD(P)H-dependent oxidoreductase [Pseudooceanicola endophyticus]MXN19812.1 ACP phosphodiesterase [Pseudooceanicola albus]